MSKRIAPEKQKGIMRMYKKGDCTMQEIANIMNVSYSYVYATIRALAEEYGIQRGNSTGGGYWQKVLKFKPEQEAQIAKEYYEDGETAVAVMRKWGCHPVQLQRIRKKYGQIYGAKKRGVYANEKLEDLEGGENGNGNSRNERRRTTCANKSIG